MEIARRRSHVTDLYIQGFTQTQIAEQLAVSQPTISGDIKAIHKQWRTSSIRDFDILRERELRKLDRVERESWAAWERSQKPAQAATVSTSGNGHNGSQKTSKTVADKVGDPRFLEQVQKCIASRRAILGLDSPTRIAPTSPDGSESYGAHVITELMRLSEESNGGPRIIDGEAIRIAVESNGEETSESPSGAGDEK